MDGPSGGGNGAVADRAGRTSLCLRSGGNGNHVGHQRGVVSDRSPSAGLEFPLPSYAAARGRPPHQQQQRHGSINADPSSPSSSASHHIFPLRSSTNKHSLTHLHNSHHTYTHLTSSMHNWHPPSIRTSPQLFQSAHVSFLEERAQQECRGLPCKRHSPSGLDIDRISVENDDEGRKEERRRFMLLDFSSDDEVSDSEEDSTSEDEDDMSGQSIDEVDGEDNISDNGASIDSGGVDLNNEPGHNLLGEANADVVAENAVVQDRGNHDALVHLLAASSPPFSSFNLFRESGLGSNPNHQQISQLLLSLANSEVQPLIRADIPWSLIISCGTRAQDHPPWFALHDSSSETTGPPQLQSEPSILRTLYQQNHDANGARLLQGVLRMDPPLEAVQVLLKAFPHSCLDMEGFFTACQFAHPNTSARKRDCAAAQSEGGCDKGLDLNACIDHDTDDVGEVVKLIMRQTIIARRMNSIDWGMVAFLGDARISPSHAKLLLRSTPEALIDPRHGAFGVSPLHRMASGFFIHGETNAWVEKLRLALRVAAYVRLKQQESHRSDGMQTEIPLPKGFFSMDCQLLRRRESTNSDTLDGPSQPMPAQAFYPYHELIRLLISPKFQGTKFGQHGFLQTLKACTQSDPNAFLRVDNEGNLPVHIALGSNCDTVLGTKGERRLIKYLLELDKKTSLCPEGGVGPGMKGRRLPLRLSIENAWPVYDLVINSALTCFEGAPETKCISDRDKLFIATSMVSDRPLLHDALRGPFHPRFGVHGARELVRNMLSTVIHYKSQHSGGERCHRLMDFVDKNGRTALHVALESSCPVYDLIVQASPGSIEARDPTQYGFLPFQTAARAFTASCPHSASTTNEKKMPDPNEASGIDATRTETALTEMSMLFELIRESPLCVTWGLSNNEAEQEADELDSAVSNNDVYLPKKRRRMMHNKI
ncbi:hypothetical protein ACHAWF_013695 [Thalassiosira exigua]